MIRKATPGDVQAIVDLAVESVSKNPLPVIIDQKAMRDTAIQCMGPAHFCYVSDVEGQVVGCVAACVQPSFWYQRSTCSVLLYYCRVPGDGLRLLRRFADWVKSRTAIKVAIVELEPDTDTRLIQFLKRLGFSRESKNLSYIRGA